MLGIIGAVLVFSVSILPSTDEGKQLHYSYGNLSWVYENYWHKGGTDPETYVDFSYRQLGGKPYIQDFGLSLRGLWDLDTDGDKYSGIRDQQNDTDLLVRTAYLTLQSHLGSLWGRLGRQYYDGLESFHIDGIVSEYTYGNWRFSSFVGETFSLYDTKEIKNDFAFGGDANWFGVYGTNIGVASYSAQQTLEKVGADTYFGAEIGQKISSFCKLSFKHFYVNNRPDHYQGNLHLFSEKYGTIFRTIYYRQLVSSRRKIESTSMPLLFLVSELPYEKIGFDLRQPIYEGIEIGANFTSRQLEDHRRISQFNRDYDRYAIGLYGTKIFDTSYRFDLEFARWEATHSGMSDSWNAGIGYDNDTWGLGLGSQYDLYREFLGMEQESVRSNFITGWFSPIKKFEISVRLSQDRSSFPNSNFYYLKLKVDWRF